MYDLSEMNTPERDRQVCHLSSSGIRSENTALPRGVSSNGPINQPQRLLLCFESGMRHHEFNIIRI
ncbi:hypothetical protein CDL15_Pgr019973 [Punica granatum]|uniref:Uncharacterized protein n=1 Tax=Punica granatum TaxID=22663 RepID=A0A218VQU4_PUNGR|nr:hypothetical protein CDL15_Pgr019973 [Punica granatum]